jgi:hypothetical protein
MRFSIRPRYPPISWHEDEIARRRAWSDLPPGAQGTLLAPAPRRGALYVPEGVGLVEITARGVRARVQAQPRQPRPWTRHETAELLRRVDYCARREAAVRPLESEAA